MLQPVLARASAKARPRPRAAPVMTATFPRRSLYFAHVSFAVVLGFDVDSVPCPCCKRNFEVVVGCLLRQDREYFSRNF